MMITVPDLGLDPSRNTRERAATGAKTASIQRGTLNEEATPAPSIAMLTIMKTRSLAAVTLCVLLVGSLAGCSSASLDSVAEDCGGSDAGVIADETGIVVSVNSGDALTCVVGAMFDDKAEQYAVAMIADEGPGTSRTIDGRDISVVSMAGETVVFIGAK